MKNTKTTNGKWLEETHHFRKDGTIVKSIYLKRHYIDDKFDIGTVTMMRNDTLIEIGECCYHDEDRLLKVHESLLTMVMEDTEWDEISKYESVNTRIVKKDAE